MPSLLEGFLGQQETPSFSPVYAGAALKAGLRAAPKIAQATVDFNNLLVPGLTGAYLKGESLYDHNRAGVREAAGSQIKSWAENPYALDPQLAGLLRQQGFEGATGAGGQPSNAAINNLFSTFGLQGENIARDRIAMAAGYGNNTGGVAGPQDIGITPGDVSGLYGNQINQTNAFNKYNAELDAMNSRNLIQAPLNYMSQLVGMGGSIAGMASGAGAGAGGGAYGGNGATPATAGVVGTAGGSSM